MYQNDISLIGIVDKKPELLYTKEDNDFYVFYINVERKSTVMDYIKIIVPHKILPSIKKGDKVFIQGTIRTRKFNKAISIYVLAKEIEITNDISQINNIANIKGVICKEPINRLVTKREITDLLISIDRRYNKTDYIPCIAWGINAKYASKFKIGDIVQIEGRFQSRKNRRNKILYELSITKIIKEEI